MTDADPGAEIARKSDAPGSFSDDDRDIAERIICLLRSEDYLTVLQAVVFLETKASSLQIEGFANFRDVLNHLGFVAQPYLSAPSRNRHMTEVSEHLRRAFTHPFQDAIDGALGDLDQRMWLYHIRSHFAGNDVLSPRERQRRIDAAKLKLIEARNLKGVGDIPLSARLFRECYDELQQVRLESIPSKGVMPARVSIWITTLLIGIFLGYLINAAL